MVIEEKRDLGSSQQGTSCCSAGERTENGQRKGARENHAGLKLAGRTLLRSLNRGEVELSH
jgi:hypothetical protein